MLALWAVYSSNLRLGSTKNHCSPKHCSGDTAETDSTSSEDGRLKLRELITNLFLIGMSLALLWFFGCIWVQGSHYIQEPSIPILVIETVGMVAVLGLAIYNLIHSKAK